MNYTFKLHHYSVDIYNERHSIDGMLETDASGKIVACHDLNSGDGWTTENSGETDTILDLAMEAGNKAIAAGKVPAKIAIYDGRDFLVVAYVKYDGNVACILANYESEDEEDAE